MQNWMITWSEREGQGDTFQAYTMSAAWRLPGTKENCDYFAQKLRYRDF